MNGRIKIKRNERQENKFGRGQQRGQCSVEHKLPNGRYGYVYRILVTARARTHTQHINSNIFDITKWYRVMHEWLLNGYEVFNVSRN